MKHIHILGICGTFMAGLAMLARASGYKVTGSDAHVYPPMSTQLRDQGIDIIEGYDPSQLKSRPDCVVIGNAFSRGNELVEYVLEHNLPYTSGPQWLAEFILRDHWVLGVSGTHGKTSTSSMLAWILHANQLDPGFLIGGVPKNFNLSARPGSTPFFVIEADEYDTAFFDKRSKFVHYHPRTLIINNLEYDHADIFSDLAAIQTQFHHLVRTVPANGLIITPQSDQAVQQVMQKGCWSQREFLGDKNGWQASLQHEDGSEFSVLYQGKQIGTVQWTQLGQHNVNNALAAIAAARHVGVAPELACECLTDFEGIKRRLEQRGRINGITVYDDFAHHPTAIASTLDGLRNRVANERILVILEPRSNTMRMGIHADSLAPSLQMADQVFLYQPENIGWDLKRIEQQLTNKAKVFTSVEAIIADVIQQAKPADHILIMSNGGFENIHSRILEALEQQHNSPITDNA